jgi:taurine dioxygenase
VKTVRFKVRELGNGFAAEIQDIDLSANQDADAIEELKQLWWRYGVLVFRDQHLTERQEADFSARFGPLEIHLRHEYLSRDTPEILYISNIVEDGREIGILSNNDVGWHYDQIYLPQPAVGSLLYAVELPQAGGATYFADTVSAYEQLPQDVKQTLAGKRAVQSYAKFNRAYSVPTNEAQTRKTQDIDHPVVRTHPYSGRQSLYVCAGMTTEILGLPSDESAELITWLCEWSVRPEFVYRHDWRLGDAVLWDNAASIHRREPFDLSERRLMKRTTIQPLPEVAVPF